ncbi:MAG: DUF115 domain-containing protein [Rhodospirillales bacterium]
MRTIKIAYRSLIDEAAIVRNVRHALTRDIKTIARCEARDGSLIIVGGGPSVARRIDKIKRIVNEGGQILALNEAAHFLIENGVRPWGVAHLAPSPYTARCIGTPYPDVTYFLASMVPPDAFDRTDGLDVVMWHTSGPGVSQALDREDVCIVDGGQTIGLRAFGLGYHLGFRTFHVFGMDSSFEEGELHAYRSVSYADEAAGFLLNCDGREFHCTCEMAGQAQDAIAVLNGLIAAGCKVQVYGEGLLPHRWRAVQEGRGPANLEVGGTGPDPLVLEAYMF